jgi:hypothetical protein
MTQDEKYTEQFKKALNEYIELGFNQDECNGFMHGFHKGAEAKQLILSGVVSSKFLCGNQKRHPLKRCKEQCSWCEGNE